MSDYAKADIDESEERLVGALIARPELHATVAGKVRGGDFRNDVLGELFDWIPDAKLKGGATSFEAMAIAAWLRKSGLSSKFGQDDLRRLFDFPHAAFLDYDCEVVTGGAVQRRLASLMTGFGETVASPVVTRDQLDVLAGRLADIQARGARTEAQPIRKLAAAALKELEARFGGENAFAGISTGFRELDGLMSGWRPGELIVLAARPGMGKSALALGIARHVASRGGAVLYSSLEMSGGELTERLLSGVACVPHYRMRNGAMEDHERRSMVQSSSDIHDWPLYVDDAPNQKIADVIASARRLQFKETGLKLIIVDYLQLLTPDNPKDPRQEQVAKMSRTLKQAAKSMGVPILCLAQLNRQADQVNEAPRLSHLRESGAIEQDADAVIFIWRPLIGGQCEMEKATITIAKQRHGATGSFDLEWHGPTVKFSDVTPERIKELDTYATKFTAPQRKDAEDDRMF